MANVGDFGRAGDQRAIGRAPSGGLPKPLQYAMAGMILFAIGAAAFGKITDIGTVRGEVSRPIAIRDIGFVEAADDVLLVVDPRDGSTIQTLAAGGDGFVRGVLRGLGRQRQLAHGDPRAPWRVIAWADGRVTLTDTATGQMITLNAFGQTNLAAFTRFLGGHGAR